MKYRAIYANKDKHPIVFMCEFFGVSRAVAIIRGKKRKDSPDKDAILGKLIAECQEKTRQTYGYRRVKLWLLRQRGLIINLKAVLRLMRKYTLLAQIRRPRPLHQCQQRIQVYENKLNRNFYADKPNQKWVTDISYIPTGGVSVSVGDKDLYDNFIVAYDMAAIQNNALVYRTIQKAKKVVVDGLVLHSDQGFQYTSPGYLKLIQQYCILPSMSRAGTPLDNAPAENFFGILKTESIYRKKIQTIQQAKNLIDDYIHFYNFERIQLKSKLTPFEKRCQFA